MHVVAIKVFSKPYKTISAATKLDQKEKVGLRGAPWQPSCEPCTPRTVCVQSPRISTEQFYGLAAALGLCDVCLRLSNIIMCEPNPIFIAESSHKPALGSPSELCGVSFCSCGVPLVVLHMLTHGFVQR